MAIMMVRTLIMYGLLFLTMRLLGKRQLGEMELSEFVLAALVADLAANPLQDIGMPLLIGIVPVITLFCCEVLMTFAALKGVRLRAVLFGKPCFLVVRGQIDQKELRKNRFTVDELLQELRNQGVMDISKVQYAVLETDGTLNVMLYAAEKPVTPSAMQLAVSEDAYFYVVICDGRVLGENLRSIGLDENWLTKQLRQRKLGSAKDVFLMAVNESKEVYLAPKEEKG